MSILSKVISGALGGVEQEAATFAGVAGAGVLAVAIAFGVGFYKGDTYRANIDDAAGAKSQVEFLQTQLKARDAAANQQAAQAQADHEALAAELENAKNAQSQITAGPCFDGGDANRLRDLWGTNPVRKH